MCFDVLRKSYCKWKHSFNHYYGSWTMGRHLYAATQLGRLDSCLFQYSRTHTSMLGDTSSAEGGTLEVYHSYWSHFLSSKAIQNQLMVSGPQPYPFLLSCTPPAWRSEARNKSCNIYAKETSSMIITIIIMCCACVKHYAHLVNSLQQFCNVNCIDAHSMCIQSMHFASGLKVV